MAISHEQHRPDRRLDGVVQRVLTTRVDDGETAEIPVPPSGAIYLNYSAPGRIKIRFGDGSVREAAPLYCGGQLVAETPVGVLESPIRVVGLEFSPTGFHRVFGVDCSRLTDRMVDLSEIDQAFAASLGRRLETATSARRAAVMQDAVIERLSAKPAPSPADRAVERIRETRGRISVAELAVELEVTPRHLRRLFARRVGISPKQYAKIVQVNAVLAAIRPGQSGKIQQLALENGYYDQSHFIRDFTRHIGQNPTEFLAGGNRFLEFYLGRKARR